MPADMITILFLLTLSLILGISLIFVIQDLFRLEKRLQSSDEENKAFKQALQSQADILMEDAAKRSMHIVDEANQKAVEIVSAAESFNAAAKADLRSSLQAVTRAEREELTQVSRELEKQYADALKQAQEDSSQIMKNITKDIEKQAVAELAEFTAGLRQELAASQRTMQEQLAVQHQNIQKDVESYKKTQMENAQKQIFQLVRFLTEAALGKGLTVEQHQDLVLQALEEAKAQGVISEK